MTIQLVDVGARDGVDPRWVPYYPELEVTAFEPEPAECARLNARTWPHKMSAIPTALGARNDEAATLYVTRQPGCSSTLKPNTDFARKFPYGPNMEVVHTVPVLMQRMDSVVTVQPDVMKLDTQGTELDVLRGAGALLDNALAVELEVEFVEQYIGQALFADVDSFMRSKGFTLRGLRRTYWRAQADHIRADGGQIVHGDALYLRLDRIESPTGLKILAAYKQYDLLAALHATNLIPRQSRWRALLGKLKVNRELRRFVDSLRPPVATDWHDPDFF